MKHNKDFVDRVKHGYAKNNRVKIHYATLGEGPLMVMIHGFPDFWYTWRHQMERLSDQFQVVAVDLRGYNESDKPKGVENYAMPLLVSDIVAVIRHLHREKAIVVGHDWGGSIAWNLAMKAPNLVEKLIICNLPHPRGLMRELANNPEQRSNSQYARNFQKAGAHENLTAENLADLVGDPEARRKYIEAFNKSDFEAMLNYYKANYPREPYIESSSPVITVKCPVLMIHGLKDRFLLPGALNDTWKWIEKDLTLVTIPNANHFVQKDAADLVTRTMRMWLNR
jgi:pimeloyl-ACP methyl ester carboxylesterase